jgi:hypothetical protein
MPWSKGRQQISERGWIPGKSSWGDWPKLGCGSKGIGVCNGKSRYRLPLFFSALPFITVIVMRQYVEVGKS